MKIFTIIPSGGTGKRAETVLPKQYTRFNGKELIAYTLDVFQNCEMIDEIVISAQKDYFKLLNDIKEQYSFTKLSKIVEGGEERQNSVFNALKSLNASDEDLIIVHDAVRPLLPKNVLINAIETAKKFGSAVVATKAKDTLIKGNHFVLSFVDRKEFYYAQTPQIFSCKILSEAFMKASDDKFLGTDESMLVHRLGYKIKLVEGSSFNFKITNHDDIKLFQLISEHS
ncbi:MAG: 2-C-methyl-D-erythritol 4-phosphate cytidylyltransferase [Ignavibacteriales bacterium]|nr:2-C-methyl-D-erythritol 4-phosphate cytidylyltransferase [Ignavibacteriales bacterium]